MSDYQDLISTKTDDWPYPVNYGRENKVSTDVLIIGGGIAGCHAGISAAKRGVKVVVVDKGPVIRSGSGGGGVDHWHGACTNPCSQVTPDDMIELVDEYPNGVTTEYGNGITCYILCNESWDALLDMEKMGMHIRDEEDEFSGADFRDEETKLMFAYDYENRHCIRVQGANVKPALYKELKTQGVNIYDRVMVTSLLTEGGKQGSKVVGAAGLHVRTGEFYIFETKATVLCSAQPKGIWVFNTELQGAAALHDDPNCAGDGHAMAWMAGAEFTLMEGSAKDSGAFHYPGQGTGHTHNTWYGCSIVDTNGKEVPWVDKDGRPLKTVSDRFRPAPGQKFFSLNPPPAPASNRFREPTLIPDLPERIKKGEFVLPFYADLPGMPEHERRAIFGLMVANECKTRIPIYDLYTKAGFDPDKDMLQSPIMQPQEYTWGPWSRGTGPPQWRETTFVSGGGVVFDWDLKTTLEGLYAAGNQLAGGGYHAAAAATGRYAARKAVEYASKAKEPIIERSQVEREKNRVYAPVNRKDGIGWKELQAGICRIMQDYCGEFKSEVTLKAGLNWLKSIRESESERVFARNPHQLMRSLDCLVRLTVSEMIILASLARKASCSILDFKRIDYPELDPSEWDKFVIIRLENGEVKVGELPYKYWLLPPNASTYSENYKRHFGL
jgi:succinate dehydrogenase/fumarate reductase flavoprotein subunit